MSLEQIKIFGEFQEMSSAEVQGIALGTIPVPEEWGYIDIIDLGELDPEMDFETPGLHKRVRAGVRALTNRNGSNVSVKIKSEKIESPGWYKDYDRVILASFESDGSSFGSSRGASVRISDTYHVTESKTIETGGLYTPQDYLVGIFTDSNGTPRTLGKFMLSRLNPDGLPILVHPEAKKMYDNLSKRARDFIVESYLKTA